MILRIGDVIDEQELRLPTRHERAHYTALVCGASNEALTMMCTIGLIYGYGYHRCSRREL